MSIEEGRLDLLIFGATGFTGKYAVEETLKFSNAQNSFTWGIAGRSASKLQKVLEEVSKKTGDDLSGIPVIEADLDDYESLVRMSARARILLNCVGPYRLFGEPVVKACIESGTHQVDVTGEPQYMERMQLEYNKAAEEKNVLVVSACGYDSIPAEMGLVFLEDHFGGDVNAVEVYVDFRIDVPVKGPIIHNGTWDSVIHTVANYSELQSIRQKLFPNKLPKLAPKLRQRILPHKITNVDGWALPFPGPDQAVINRSQRYFYEQEKKRPIQCETYIALPTIRATFTFLFVAMLCSLLTICKCGVKLLIKRAKTFSFGYVSHEGPTEEIMNNTHFKFTLVAQGWKGRAPETTGRCSAVAMNKKVVAQVKGTNPAYGAACTALVVAALIILQEREKIPAKGGVLTPAVAFAKTSMIEELNKNGLTFDIISSEEK